MLRLAAAPPPSDAQCRAAQLALVAMAELQLDASPDAQPAPSPASEPAPLPLPPPPLPDADATFPVADILFSRRRGAVREFLVVWAGAPNADSWVPESELDPEDLHDVPALDDDEPCCSVCDLPYDTHPTHGPMLLCDGCNVGSHLRCWRPGRSRCPPQHVQWFCDACASASEH